MQKFILILVFISAKCFSQYMDLDGLKSSFTVWEYGLGTKELYGIDRKVEIYNIFLSPHSILLLSVLPSLDENTSNWEKINQEKFASKTLTKTQILNLAAEWQADNQPGKKTFSYSVVKKINGNVYKSKNCLAEFFEIKSLDTPLSTAYGVINTNEPPISLQAFYKKFQKEFPKEWFILDPRSQFRMRENYSYVLKYFLSKSLSLNSEKAYQFWTLDGWWSTDGLNSHRGIDRFIYLPDYGIVGGSYDFWFAQPSKRLSVLNTDLLWNNILNEKVMIADELKK